MWFVSFSSGLIPPGNYFFLQRPEMGERYPEAFLPVLVPRNSSLLKSVNFLIASVPASPRSQIVPIASCVRLLPLPQSTVQLFETRTYFLPLLSLFPTGNSLENPRALRSSRTSFHKHVFLVMRRPPQWYEALYLLSFSLITLPTCRSPQWELLTTH